MHKPAIPAFLSLVDLHRSAKASVVAALTGLLLVSGLSTAAPAANVDRLIQGFLGLPVGPAPELPRAPPRPQRQQADDPAGAVQGGQQA
ncbi:hypothetical protein, partial [Rhizobium leguminosarum]|uniref:hypothetical protein n=1 Tax=Rhizobium leguminosarum TaxID=384 RepID=UPI001953F378